MDPDGDFVIAYTLGGSFSDFDINAGIPTALANAYDSTGTEAEIGFQVATPSATNNDFEPSIALSPNGNLAAAWENYGTLTDGEGFNSNGVFTQTFSNSPFTYTLPAGNSIRMAGGMPKSYTIQIIRDNNFTGLVSVAIFDLPAGVHYSVSPDSSAVSDPRTITFTTADNVSVSAKVHLQIVSGGLTLTPALNLECNPSEIISVSTPVVPGFSIGMYGIGFVAGSVVQFGSPGVNNPALQATPKITEPDPTIAGNLTVTVPASAKSGPITIWRPGGLPIVSSDTFTIVSSVVTGLNQTRLTTPYLQHAGTKLIISGFGFKLGAKVQIGDVSQPNGVLLSTPTNISADGQSITVNTGIYAITGQVLVIEADGSSATSPQTVTVTDFAGTNGFDFLNVPTASTNLTDLTNLYGYGATHDFIGLFDTGFYVSDPYALAYLYAVRAGLDDGQCFGFALAATRLFYGDKGVSSFPPVGATGAYQLDQSGSLLSYIHSQHIAQESAEGLKIQADNAGAHGSFSSQQIANEINGYLAAGRLTIVNIHAFNEGHSLLAYATEPGAGPGDFYIDVYDPNKANLPGAADATLIANLTSSRIHVFANNTWLYNGRFGMPLTAAQQTWSGPFNQMTFIPNGVIPVQPTIPGQSLVNAILGGLIVVLGGGAVTQVSDSSGHTLFNPNGSLNGNPNTALPHSTTVKDDLSSGGPKFAIGVNDVTETFKANGSPFSQTLLNDGFGAQLFSGADPNGVIDTISLLADKSLFGFMTTGPARTRSATDRDSSDRPGADCHI